MKGRIALFILSFAIWSILTWPFDLQNATIGLLVAAFVAFLTGDMFIQSPRQARPISRYLWFFYYVPMCFWECLKANIDVAIRVLHPRMPINPGIVKVKTNLKSDTGLTFLANSITLTPGTFCIDIDPEEGILYIHWLNVESQETGKATQLIAEKFENILKRIFD